MAIADFNRDNPFIIIIRKLEDELYKKTLVMTKCVILYSVITFILSVSMTIMSQNVVLFLLIIFTLISILHNAVYWKLIVSKGEFSTVNKIIYGEEFSSTTVNNEKLFDMIQSMNIAKGELNSFKTKLIYDITLWVLLALIIILF
jgi:hypothetical protein